MVVHVFPRTSCVDSWDQSISSSELSTRLPIGDHLGVDVSPMFMYAIMSSRAIVCPAGVVKVRSVLGILLSPFKRRLHKSSASRFDSPRSRLHKPQIWKTVLSAQLLGR